MRDCNHDDETVYSSGCVFYDINTKCLNPDCHVCLEMIQQQIADVPLLWKMAAWLALCIILITPYIILFR